MPLVRYSVVHEEHTLAVTLALAATNMSCRHDVDEPRAHFDEAGDDDERGLFVTWPARAPR